MKEPKRKKKDEDSKDYIQYVRYFINYGALCLLARFRPIQGRLI